MNTVGIRITVLSDNTAVARNVLGEHGLAFWLDTGEDCLLFDTGQGLALADNARALRVNLQAIDMIVLSHGHYDHTGGLADVLRQAKNRVTVYAHPDALLPKYRQEKQERREIGMPARCREAMSASKHRFHPTRQAVEVTRGIWTTGEIPRRHHEETTTELFRRNRTGNQPDLLLDDQAVFIPAEKGTIVLLGCAHSGVINTLDHIQALTDRKPIRAVLGGMHLRPATEDRMAWTIRELRRFKIDFLVPMHCTGIKAVAALWAAFPAACREGGAGTVFEF